MVQQSGYELLAWLAGVGAALGLGQLLMSDEKITVRRAAGRAIVTAGLAAGSATVLIAIPQLGFVPLVALACATASLGTSGLERLIQKHVLKS